MAEACETGPAAKALWIENAALIPTELMLRTLPTEQGFAAILAPKGACQALPDSQLLELGQGRFATGLGEALGTAYAQFVALSVAGRVAHVWRRRLGSLAWIAAGELMEPVWHPTTIAGGDVEEAELSLSEGSCGLLVDRLFCAATGASLEQLGTWLQRWSGTGMDAFQLRDAAVKTGARLAQARGSQLEGLSWALRARARITATLWTGPPMERQMDAWALGQLLKEPGYRLICGDTTAQIAARLLDKPLIWEPADLHQRTDAPPSSRLEGITLVTEGVVTLRRATEWLRGAETLRDLPSRLDASTRLARLLLRADCIRFLVGQALNPVQAESFGDSAPIRVPLVRELAELMRSRGKLVSLEWI